MTKHVRTLAAVGAVAMIAGSVATATTASARPGHTKAANRVVSRSTTLLNSCKTAHLHHASCLAVLRAHRVTLANGTVQAAPAATTPSGYGPADLASAYKLPTSTAGSGQTVAIVDAFNDPAAASDLAVYRSQYGLPACTVASGCFRQLNENGKTSPLPAANSGWAQEESLDVDMVSAICPNCKIILLEASTATDADLTKAVNEAATLGATEISNSYGGKETKSETSLNSAYNHPGIAITASAGDGGYGVEFPAAVPTVTSVGGTALKHASNSRGWTETVWGSKLPSVPVVGPGGTGSGCSKYEPKPTWQKDTGCSMRTVADVSAVADPRTGVAVYDSTPDRLGDSGWLEFGGTSVSSPIIASVYALAGNAASTNAASFAYSHPSSLFDVTSGTNGVCGTLNPATKYLCTARPGYDGPTGLGTPNGTGAF